jgi:hypothetical protein
MKIYPVKIEYDAYNPKTKKLGRSFISYNIFKTKRAAEKYVANKKAQTIASWKAHGIKLMNWKPIISEI